MQWPCCVQTWHALAVTPDGCHVVSCSEKDVHLWNLSTGAEVMVFHADAELTAVTVTPDGCHVVAGSKSGNVHVWSISTGKEVTVLQGHTCIVSAVAVSPDGSHVVHAPTRRLFECGTPRPGRRHQVSKHTQPRCVLGE